MNFNWDVFWQYLLQPSGVYLTGLWLTCLISVLAMLLGCVLGLAAALLRLSKNPLLHLPVRLYVWLMRGTPLLVQIVFLYTALAAGGIFRFEDIELFGLIIPGNIQAAIIALGLNEGAYMAEIIRAGIGAVDKGQYEAGRSLGMGFGKLMRRIVLPQAFRVIVPPLGFAQGTWLAVIQHTAAGATWAGGDGGLAAATGQQRRRYQEAFHTKRPGPVFGGGRPARQPRHDTGPRVRLRARRARAHF